MHSIFKLFKFNINYTIKHDRRYLNKYYTVTNAYMRKTSENMLRWLKADYKNTVMMYRYSIVSINARVR